MSSSSVAANSEDSRNGITWQESFAQAETFKCEGNDLYKMKEYRKAMGKYHRALFFLRGIENNLRSPFPGIVQPPKPLSSEDQSRVSQVTVDCYNNLAACLLHSEEPSYKRILECCDKALESSPSNVKALFRKGVALFHLHNTEKALAVLKQASGLPGGKSDANISKYIKLCNEDIAKQEEELKSRCKAMFAAPKQAHSST